MSTIKTKEPIKAEDSANNSPSVRAALARYTRHIAEQEHQLDLLTLYMNLEENDPLRLQLNKIQLQGSLIFPHIQPLADVALAYELLYHIEQSF